MIEARSILKKIYEITNSLLAPLSLKIVLLSPMEKVLFKLKYKKVKLRNLDALELFARMGTDHTLDYKNKVKSIEAWEIEESYEVALRYTLPEAKVKITNTFKEVKETNKKYGFVVCDNWMSTYGPNDAYCEHFELFPDIFNLLTNQAILIVNVIPFVSKPDKEKRPSLFNNEQLKRRKIFYKTEHPENLSLKEIASIYSLYANQNRYDVKWYFTEKRSNRPHVYYLVMSLQQNSIERGEIVNERN
jgi:hypothetical protein